MAFAIIQWDARIHIYILNYARMLSIMAPYIKKGVLSENIVKTSIHLCAGTIWEMGIVDTEKDVYGITREK